MTTQDNRELENVYEEIQKKMGWMGVKAGTGTRMVETQSRTLPRLGPRREPAIQVWTLRESPTIKLRSEHSETVFCRST